MLLETQKEINHTLRAFHNQQSGQWNHTVTAVIITESKREASKTNTKPATTEPCIIVFRGCLTSPKPSLMSGDGDVGVVVCLQWLFNKWIVDKLGNMPYTAISYRDLVSQLQGSDKFLSMKDTPFTQDITVEPSQPGSPKYEVKISSKYTVELHTQTDVMSVVSLINRDWLRSKCLVCCQHIDLWSWMRALSWSPYHC